MGGSVGGIISEMGANTNCRVVQVESTNLHRRKMIEKVSKSLEGLKKIHGVLNI
jgi:hypothetical protein